MLRVQLQSPIEASLFRFYRLKEGRDVAKLLEVDYGQLLYLLYDLDEGSRYLSFTIPKKSGGLRTINKPCSGISILQAKLKTILDSIYLPKDCCHGFVSDRNVVTNAKQHLGARYVLNVDLEDFYGSINFGRIFGLFQAKPFLMGRSASAVLAQLVTFGGSLPQGACTSPVLSNMIALELDGRLTRLARRFHLKYTRYADDITFSTRKDNFPREVFWSNERNPFTGENGVGSALHSAIVQCGFRLNSEKTRLQVRGVRQEVTGLTVNVFANVQRKFVRQIRAMIHAWRKFGAAAAEREYLLNYSKDIDSRRTPSSSGAYFKRVVYGKLSYLKMVRGDMDQVFLKLAKDVSRLDGKPPSFIRKVMSVMEEIDVFIGHASEDKDNVARPIFDACKKANLKVFFDEKDIGWGDSLTEVINNALGRSKYFLAIVSMSSIGKSWPERELFSAISNDINRKQKILPLVVGDSKEVFNHFPILADRLYLTWDGDAEKIASRIKALVSGD